MSLNDATIQHRCIAVKLYNKSLNAGDLAAAIHKELGIKPLDCWHYCSRDGAAVNGAAIDHLRFLYPLLVDLICLSHAINIIGSVFSVKCIIMYLCYDINSHLEPISSA